MMKKQSKDQWDRLGVGSIDYRITGLQKWNSS
jgi:hypothetical protein